MSWQQFTTEDIGDDIFALAAKVYPICRSITGDGVRATLREIGTHIALEIHEVPTGTPVFDWTVPREWNIRDAYIKNGLDTEAVATWERALKLDPTADGVKKKIQDMQDRRGRAKTDRSKASQ